MDEGYTSNGASFGQGMHIEKCQSILVGREIKAVSPVVAAKGETDKTALNCLYSIRMGLLIG